MVFMKVIERIWANEFADGQKIFECVANKRMWQNQSKLLSSGDPLIIVVKGRDRVNAVCEGDSDCEGDQARSIEKQSPESHHEARDAYLGGAEPWDYVECKHVFDCRCPIPATSIKDSFERVGLAASNCLLGRLLRPVAIDAQWPSRLPG